MIEMLPNYSTILFSQVWDNKDDFYTDFKNSPFANSLKDDSINILFYLLFARYGNNPIANNDIAQWKIKIFSTIFQYGPTWEKRLEIQEKLRSLSEDEIFAGTKAVHNHAFNPSTIPSDSTMSELPYVNDQNTSQYKYGKIDAYGNLWSMLRTDITEEFLREFKKCFKFFVSSEFPILYDEEDC